MVIWRDMIAEAASRSTSSHFSPTPHRGVNRRWRGTATLAGRGCRRRSRGTRRVARRSTGSIRPRGRRRPRCRHILRGPHLQVGPCSARPHTSPDRLARHVNAETRQLLAPSASAVTTDLRCDFGGHRLNELVHLGCLHRRGRVVRHPCDGLLGMLANPRPHDHLCFADRRVTPIEEVRRGRCERIRPESSEHPCRLQSPRITSLENRVQQRPVHRVGCDPHRVRRHLAVNKTNEVNLGPHELIAERHPDPELFAAVRHRRSPESAVVDGHRHETVVRQEPEVPLDRLGPLRRSSPHPLDSNERTASTADGCCGSASLRGDEAKEENGRHGKHYTNCT